MNNSKRFKRKDYKQNAEIMGCATTYMQPFKEMPSVNMDNSNNTNRINAHELFSLYTANVIKEKIVYNR